MSNSSNSWRLVVPIVDPAMSDAMLDTIDAQLHPSVIVIDNGMRVYRPKQNVQLYRHRHNLGVAGSWNLGVQLANEQGASYVMLASSSTRFGAGARDIDVLVEIMSGADILALMPAPTYWHTALLHVSLFDIIGTVDENFYPAYYEECDVERRALLAGIEIIDNGQIACATIDASTVRDGHGVDVLRDSFPRLATINYDALSDYWHRKWGCHVDDRRNLDVGYRTPFNENVPLSYWPPIRSIPNLRARYQIVGR